MSRMRAKTAIWTNAEDEVVKAGISKYGMNNWERVASLIDTHSAQECKDRWYQFLDPHINKGEWSRLEEEKLVELQELFPEQWALISSQIDRRTAWQCEQHYEALLQRMQSAGNGDVRQALRPLEQLAEPEIRPARPDAASIDDAEKDMLEAAVARLANKHGKKGLRSARQDQLNEATAIAQLEREREMKMSGHTSGKVQKRIQQALDDDLATRKMALGDNDDDDDQVAEDGDDAMPDFESVEVNLQFKTKQKKDQLVVGEKRPRTDKEDATSGAGGKAARTEAIVIGFADDDADSAPIAGATASVVDFGALFGGASSDNYSNAVNAQKEKRIQQEISAALLALPEVGGQKKQSQAAPTGGQVPRSSATQAQAEPFAKKSFEPPLSNQRIGPALPAFKFSADDVVDEATQGEAAALILDMKERRWIYLQHQHLPCEPGETDSTLLEEARALIRSAASSSSNSTILEKGRSLSAAMDPLEYMSCTVAIEQMQAQTLAFREDQKAQEAAVLDVLREAAEESERVEDLRRQLYFYEKVVKPREADEARRRLAEAEDEVTRLTKMEDDLQREYQAVMRHRRSAAAAAASSQPTTSAARAA